VAAMMVVMMWRIGVGAELERTTKMECENESGNEHFCKMGGVPPFCKNAHLLCHSHVNSRFHFQK
jgi:hypothetical protein